MVWIPGLTTNAVLPPRIQHLLNLGGTLLVFALGMVGRFVGLGPTWPDQSVVKLEKYERHRGKRILHLLIIVKARIIVLGLLYVVLPRWLPYYLLRKMWWWAGFWLTTTTWGLQVGAVASVIAYYGWRHRCIIIGSYVSPYFVGLELGMKAIDLEIEWDPLFRQSCIAFTETSARVVQCCIAGDSKTAQEMQQPARVSHIHIHRETGGVHAQQGAALGRSASCSRGGSTPRDGVE